MRNEEFQKIVELICGPNWQDEDPQGGLGVAIMLSFINGIQPTLLDLSKDLDIHEEELDVPFMRMLRCGLFSKAFNARNDVELLGEGFSPNKRDVICYQKGKKSHWSAESAYMNAWCFCAGIASDRIQRNIPKYK